MSAEPAPARAGRAGRGRRLRRLARRAAIVVVVAWAALTVASFGYNLATDDPPGQPSGLTFATGGGFHTRYLAWGDHGSPVVLVPGAFETAGTFATLGRALGASHRVYAIDLTGTGYSAPSPPYSAGHLAEQLLAFLVAEHLTGPDAPVLVGHSSGAAVVGMAALRQPRAVAGIVFLDGDATPLASPGLAGWLFVNPYRTSLVRLAVGSGWLIRQVYQSQCGPRCPPLSAAGLRAWQLPLQQPAFVSVVAYSFGHGIPSMTGAQLARLRATAVAKLVVYGRDDPQMSAADAAATAVRIGAAAPVTVPGRHLTMISAPGQLAEIIDAFIRARVTEARRQRRGDRHGDPPGRVLPPPARPRRDTIPLATRHYRPGYATLSPRPLTTHNR